MTPAPLTAEEIAEAERLCEEATPGPWNHDKHSWSPWVWREHPDIPGVIQSYVFKCGSREDALFVAAARTLVPRLLALHRADSARIAELERANSAHRAMAMLEPKEMSYQDRSEFERLKRADVDQGRRIASLTARIAELSAALVEACDLTEHYVHHTLPISRNEADEKIAALRAVAKGDRK